MTAPARRRRPERDMIDESLFEAEDAGFAEQVRKAIFTFVHLPTRLYPRDVP